MGEGELPSSDPQFSIPPRTGKPFERIFEVAVICIKLQGGLGNQLFQYGAGLGLARFHHTELVVDSSFYREGIDRAGRSYELVKLLGNNVREIDEDLLENLFPFAKHSDRNLYCAVINKILRSQAWRLTLVFCERKFYRYDDSFKSLPPDVYLYGFWQTYKYVQVVEAEIRDMINHQANIRECNSHKIESFYSEKIAVHCRLGDYLNPSEIFYQLNADYYRRAMAQVSIQTGCDEFVLFSDEPEKAAQLLDAAENIHIEIGNDVTTDFLNMIHCKHFIISNSTYSWWAALIANSKDKIVMYPDRWFKNPEWSGRELFPTEWLSVSTASEQ